MHVRSGPSWKGHALMSILNDMLNFGGMGEPHRLDYVIREHEKLQARVIRLEELLLAKGLITEREKSTLDSQEDRSFVAEPDR
jgi:hypothetical protein